MMKKGGSSAPIGYNDAYVTLMKAAREDREIRETVNTIVHLSSGQRKQVIYGVVKKMEKDSLPADFIEAVTALSDDRIADKAREILVVS